MLKNLDSMIFSVANQYISIAHDSYSFQTFEFSVSRPPASKRSQECSVGLEDLDSIVPRVAHKNKTLIVDRDPSET